MVLVHQFFVPLQTHFANFILALPEKSHWVVKGIELVVLTCCWPCHLYKSGVQRLQVALVLTVLKVSEFEGFIFD